MANLKIQTTGFRHTRRIVSGDAVIAIAGQFSNGRWGAFDINDRRMTLETFATPNGVRKWVEANLGVSE